MSVLVKKSQEYSYKVICGHEIFAVLVLGRIFLKHLTQLLSRCPFQLCRALERGIKEEKSQLITKDVVKQLKSYFKNLLHFGEEPCVVVHTQSDRSNH